MSELLGFIASKFIFFVELCKKHYAKYAGFSLTLILTNNDRICDFVLLRKNAGLRKPVLWHILHNEMMNLDK